MFKSIRLYLFVVGLVLGLIGTFQSPALADASAAQPVASSLAVAHARRVEARALKSSFAELEAFGREAAQRGDEEGLSRLQHVTWIMINQHDAPMAERWNEALRQAAERQRNRPYLEIAKVNDLEIRRFGDEEVPLEEYEALAARQTDPIAKAFAQNSVAMRLIDARRSGDAFRVLVGVVRDIPEGQEGVASLGAAVWSRISVAHMMVDDVSGFLTAITRAEDYMAASSYPRPDYESLYHLTQSLGFLGRYEEAQYLMAAYSRLAHRTNTRLSRSHAGSLCAYEATVRDDWAAVLKCLAPFGPNLEQLQVNASYMLAHRATAYARTGNPVMAGRDLAEVERRVAAGLMRPSLPVLQARGEVPISQGDYAHGVTALREYHLFRFLKASQLAASVNEQVVVSIDDQLQAATEQNALKARMIDSQRWIVGILIVLAIGAAFAFWRQRQLSQQLEDAGRRLQDAFDAKTAFFANMSHEIRTPLNGVVAMADALGRRRLDEGSTDMVRIIASSGATLERLLSDILDSAKMEARHLEIEATPFNLGEMVAEIEGLWRQAAFKKGIRIAARLDPAADRWVMADRVRLSQLLNNLISNALKFTSEGEVVLSVEAAQADRIRFTVRDTGVGFDAEQKARIFERFQQADGSITRRFGGTGLGLSISRQLAELMDGDLDCDSTPGKGSRFWFELPMPKVVESATIAPAPVTAAPEAAKASVLKMLIVDDHPANRTILGMLLEDEATELHYVENGRESVEALSSGVFDVVLMDMEMPVMGGLEATRAIRAMEAETGADPTTIIIFSANSSSEDQRRGRDAGADGHIAKPVVLERLLEGIDLAMRQNRQRRAAA